MNQKTTKQMTEQEVKTMKKVVIYIRHTEGRPGPGIEEQRNACRKYAAEHGYTILREYIDYSEDDLACNRDEFLKMIRDSEKKRFQGVLVYSTDRISRYSQDIVFYGIMLKKNGADFISATETYRTDPSVILQASILQAYVDYMHYEHSRKVKRGMQLAKERKAALAAAEKQANS